MAKRFGGVTALADVNLRLGRGEVLGLIGDNGAGKSTLIKILCGFHQPDAGRIFVDGEEVVLKSVDHARTLGIDTVYQDLALVNELSVYHNMFLNRELVRWPLLSNRRMRRLAREHLEDMGVNIPSVDDEVAKLSGGQRQAIAVARSVYSDARILLLDEPLAAMGAKEGALILDLVARPQGQGRRLDHHHRPQLRPGPGGLRPDQPAPARVDHLRQADLRDVGAGADRPGRGRVPGRPDPAAAARPGRQRATGPTPVAAMRALVVAGPGRSAVTDVPEPVPGPGEVLVSVEAAGICGSDLELLDGRRPAAYVSYPVVPGHEWAGRVEALGPGVRDLAPGDPVVAEGLRSCGVCDRCAEGRTNLCAAGYAETGFTHPGALAERLAIPARLVHRLPPDRPLAPAALLEPAACVASGLLEAGMPLPGTRVAVVGDGPLGLLALLLLATASPAELVLVGGRPARSALGPGCGATRVVAAGDPDALAGLAGHFDTVVEATNDPAGAATALTLPRRGGTALLLGISGAGRATIDPDVVTLNQLRVQGGFAASTAAWRWVAGLYATGALDPTPLVTHQFPLDQVATAFAALTAPDGNAVKILIRM